MTRIEDARAFAEAAHRGQTRKGAGREPYFTHLEEVAALVTRFGGDEETVMAAWLHDTVEDCGVISAGIAARFGARVAGMVAELTDDKSLPKAERKRLQQVNAPGKSPGAALVKLCDKLSNVRSVGQCPPEQWSQARRIAYVDWAEAVVAALPELPADALSAFGRVLRETRAALDQ